MTQSNDSESAVLGIMLLDTRFPRIPGDIGNARSYSFPVRLHTVKGATVQRVIRGDRDLLKTFVDAAQELERQGVCAITSSCGFLVDFQETVAKAVGVPVFLSSLIQIPLVHMMTQKRIGLITGDAANLQRRDLLAAAGVPRHVPVAIAGMEEKPAYSSSVLRDGAELDRGAIEREMLEVAGELLTRNPDIGAFCLECHNFAPYAAAIAKATQRPVFDIISFAEWVYRSQVKQVFPS